jgi:hypothetical protein
LKKRKESESKREKNFHKYGVAGFDSGLEMFIIIQVFEWLLLIGLAGTAPAMVEGSSAFGGRMQGTF